VRTGLGVFEALEFDAVGANLGEIRSAPAGLASIAGGNCGILKKYQNGIADILLGSVAEFKTDAILEAS
jgi:hypothetical protein